MDASIDTNNTSETIKILIVDDDDALAEGLALLLREPGRQVATAYSPDRARALFLEQDPDLVITDVCMTGRNDTEGLTLLDWVKTLKPGLDVVVISGYGTTETERLTRIYGGLRFFHKPLDPEILTSLVQNLSIRRSGPPSGQTPALPGPLSDDAAEQLRRDYLTGNDQALSTLLAGYRSMVFSICLNWYRLEAAETEDVYQEASIEVMLKISRIRRPRAFIVGTVMNLCKKHLVNIGRTRRRTAEENAAENIPVYQDLSEESDQADRLADAMNQLDEPNRRLLHLLFMEDVPYAEVAQRLGLSIGSIGPLRMRALNKLKQLFKSARS